MVKSACFWFNFVIWKIFQLFINGSRGNHFNYSFESVILIGEKYFFLYIFRLYVSSKHSSTKSNVKIVSANMSNDKGTHFCLKIAKPKHIVMMRAKCYSENQIKPTNVNLKWVSYSKTKTSQNDLFICINSQLTTVGFTYECHNIPIWFQFT